MANMVHGPTVASVPITLVCKMVAVANDNLSNISLKFNYPLYRRRSPDNGEQVSNISMMIGSSGVDQEIDNR